MVKDYVGPDIFMALTFDGVSHDRSISMKVLQLLNYVSIYCLFFHFSPKGSPHRPRTVAKKTFPPTLQLRVHMTGSGH